MLDEGAGDNGSAPLIRNELLTFVSQKFNYMPTITLYNCVYNFMTRRRSTWQICSYTSAVPTAVIRRSGIDAGRGTRLK